MLNFLKKLDTNFFNSFIYKTKQRVIKWIKLKNITDLPKNIDKDFNLFERFNFFKCAAYYLQTNRINGVYCEFGCHTASTFRMALRTLGLPFKPNKINRFYAFDSFEGMPDAKGIDKQTIWKEGINTTQIEKFKKLIKKDLYRTKIVKGFYNDSLKNYNLLDGDKVAMAYLDCDYYSSTVDCLKFLDNKYLHGSILVFDDWNCYYSDPQRGQRLAFEEYREEKINKYEFVEFFQIKTGGMSFIVLEKNKIGKEVL